MEPEKKAPVVSDLGAWGMNVVSSVGIIMANKQLMSSAGYAFSFATTLTGFHFTITALVGYISRATGYSASKHVPLWELVWFSLVANTSITGMNLSLMLNSVGFYQISKLSMIPVVCLMEWVINSKHYTTKVISAVVVVAAGVGICTVTDVEVNAKGFICACVAVFCTSLQQIFIFRRDLKWCPTFSKLKTLLLNEYWCVPADFHALAYILEHSPILENLTLHFFSKGPKHEVEIKGSYNVVESSAAISEHLKTVQVKCNSVDAEVLKILEFLGTLNICFEEEKTLVEDKWPISS